MKTISHRELRNQSVEVRRRVEAGETLIVTNHGRPAAVIGPVGASVIDELAAAGQVRLATGSLESLRNIRRVTTTRSSAEIIADSRGKW